MLILYSTHCPKCGVLEAKLISKNLVFKVVDDIGIMESKGLDFLPVLETDEGLLNFHDAIQYVNKIGG